MGSSTTSIRSVVDYLTSLGELGGVLPASGYGTTTWLTMATDVMDQLIAQRFNWKWNRMKVPPFYTISWQQDYAGYGPDWPAPLGWIESAYWIDINNTALPKPTYPIEAVRDLPPTSISGNPPCKIAWYPNDQLIQGDWPGPGAIYTDPYGAVVAPTNPITNITDDNGNILVLVQFGTTGTGLAPKAPVNAPEGTLLIDGTCQWVVVSPNSQGFRVAPLPPQQATVYQVNVVAQRKAPPPFTLLSQLINPIPDDYAQWFRDGMYVWAHKMSPNAQARSSFQGMYKLWIAAMLEACKQGDRETDNAGFIPDRSVISPGTGQDIGPANPYGYYFVWPGR